MATMKEALQVRFRRSVRLARARYTIEPRWSGTIELEDPAARRVLRNLARQPN